MSTGVLRRNKLKKLGWCLASYWETMDLLGVATSLSSSSGWSPAQSTNCPGTVSMPQSKVILSTSTTYSLRLQIVAPAKVSCSPSCTPSWIRCFPATGFPTSSETETPTSKAFLMTFVIARSFGLQKRLLMGTSDLVSRQKLAFCANGSQVALSSFTRGFTVRGLPHPMALRSRPHRRTAVWQGPSLLRATARLQPPYHPRGPHH